MNQLTDPFFVRVSAGEPAALVFDSPHSGLVYPADFSPNVSRDVIRTTWDAFVDELWSGATDAGATLLAATFPRAYIDANRAPDDIDGELLAESWPGPVGTTEYTRRGMGLIRRDALPGKPMYAARLTVAEVKHRLDAYYFPYRRALADLIDTTKVRQGAVWHFNCHSMKSTGNGMNVDAGQARPDFVISDRLGTTAPSKLTTWCARFFRERGFTVKINDPYKGGHIVVTHGRPAEQRYSLQIEINRARYMNESTFTKNEQFDSLCAHLRDFALAARELQRRDPQAERLAD